MIAVEELSFSYKPGQSPVLCDFSATFERGSVTVVTGSSGSGKSTLLYLLALLMRAPVGEIRWDGVVVGRLPDYARARLRASRGGFIFQDALLDPRRSVLDNVLEGALLSGMPRLSSRAKALDLLEQFGVLGRAAHRPGEISGGQAQRVALCRALIRDPAMIFADEPTGNLDLETRDLVWNALADRAMAGSTVLVATHDDHLTARADVVLAL